MVSNTNFYIHHFEGQSEMAIFRYQKIYKFLTSVLAWIHIYNTYNIPVHV